MVIQTKAIIKNRKCDKKCMETLAIKYVNALIKTENIQNRLEKMCVFMISTDKLSKGNNKVLYINNILNKIMVKLMNMQNYINLKSLTK